MFREGVRVLGCASAEACVRISATRSVSGFSFHLLMFYFLLCELCIPVALTAILR